MARELKSVIRLQWSPYLKKSGTLRYVNLLGRNVRVQSFWVPATEAMGTALIATGYENPMDWTGSYYPKYISGTSTWSWHSYGGAIDIDYGGVNPDSPWHPGIDRNPHIREKIPEGFISDPRFQITEEQVQAVLAIRNNDGTPVWRWLGYPIGDTMHMEPLCTPISARTGIDYSTVPEGISPPTQPTGGDDNMNYVKYSDGFDTTSGDADVLYWQTLLIDGLKRDTGGKDGRYGSKMIAAVKSVVPASNGNQIGPVEAAAIHLALQAPAVIVTPAGLQRGDTVKLI